MVTYSRTYGTSCDACGEDVATTYRLSDDSNGAHACVGCATEYAARVFCAEVWPVPADAWNADGAEVMEHAEGWYEGGLEALRRDARIVGNGEDGAPFVLADEARHYAVEAAADRDEAKYWEDATDDEVMRFVREDYEGGALAFAADVYAYYGYGTIAATLRGTIGAR